MSERKNITPDFSTPDRINCICEDLQTFENKRGQDRALINDQFNGSPPFTHEEATKLRVEFNINFNEGGKLLDDANRQVNGALLFKPRLAVLKPLVGKPEKQAEWGETASTHFNSALQRGRTGRRMMFLLKNRNASTTLHGIGAVMWSTGFGWRPRFIPLADLLIPTDTNCDLEDLAFFAVNFYLTQGELFDMVGGEDMETGWNKSAVYQVLHYLQKTKQKYPDPQNPVEQPEKWVEYRKQNRGFFYSANDEVPKVSLRAFYYRDPTSTKWYRKVLLRYDVYDNTPDLKVIADKTFLYTSKEVFADHLSEMLHIQYGDASRVPPLKHHSVRGLGVELYGPVQGMNRIRCQFMQHVFTNLLTWFRIKEPTDRDRLKHFILEQFAAVPEELDIVTAAERYQIDYRIVEAAQSQFRQLMNESSASFVRDIDSGTKKEMTLGEAQIRLQQVNVQVSSMLRSMYAQEVFLYQELLRRFLLKGSTDDAVKKFQEKLKKKGLPDELLNVDNWQVDVESVLGSGDQTAGQIQANLLLSQRQWMDPESARYVEREWAVVTTGDVAKGRMIVPDSQDKSTSGARAAQDLFGTLMQGIQIQPRAGIDQKGYIEQMLSLAGQKVMIISQTDNVGTQAEVIGLTNVLADIQAHVAIFARDEQNKQQSSIFGAAVSELQNVVKGFAQRQQQAAEKAAQQNGGDPKAAAAVQAMIIKAEVGAKIKEMASEQKLRHKEVSFHMDQARQSLTAMQSLSQEAAAEKQRLAFDQMDRALAVLHEAERPPRTNGDSG